MRKVFMLTLMASLVVACNPKNANEAKTGEAKKVEESKGSEYLVQTDASTLNWRGTKPSGEHIGTVSITKGDVKVDDGSISGGSFTIDLNSIVNTDLEGEWNEKLVGHLKSEDFFNTAAFPEAVFEISSVAVFSEDTAEGDLTSTHSVTGNLTMRGVTKSITFPASVEMTENGVNVRSNEFSIDRTLWDVNFKSKTIFAEFKDDFIGDMINLKFDVVFAK